MDMTTIYAIIGAFTIAKWLMAVVLWLDDPRRR